MGNDYTFVDISTYSRPSSGSWSTVDPEEGLEYAQMSTKACSLPIAHTELYNKIYLIVQ